jgi:alpha 1,2-mannosyltransferase
MPTKILSSLPIKNTMTPARRWIVVLFSALASVTGICWYFPLRLFLLQVTLFLIYGILPEGRNKVVSLAHDGGMSPSTLEAPYDYSPPPINSSERANATLLMLARNSELKDVIKSVQSLEDRFNRRYNYPWIFLNEEPFSEDFKRYVEVVRLSCAVAYSRSCQSRVSVLTNAPVQFGQIPHDHWYQPDWIDEDLAKKNRQKMAWKNIIYAGSSIWFSSGCDLLTVAIY